MMLLRGNRSAQAPPNSRNTTRGRVRPASTNPRSVAECVVDSTAKATAIGAIWSPRVLTDCAKKIRRNWGSRNNPAADMPQLCSSPLTGWTSVDSRLGPSRRATRYYAAAVSELEPQKRPKKEIAPGHIPQVVVPVPLDDVRGFVRDALRGTSLLDPVANALSGWAFFEPYLRFSSVDATHTRIELAVVGALRGVEILLFAQRRAEIDRFFVAIQDELDRRERWRPRPPSDQRS
jgi:hypothetical protein